MAVADVNADTSILPSEILRYAVSDTGSTLHGAMAGAMELLSDPDVIGLCGTGYSSTLQGAATYASIMRKPMISATATSPQWDAKADHSASFLLRSVPSRSGAIDGLVGAIKDLGWHSVAVLGSDSEYGHAVWGAFTASADRANLDVVAGNFQRSDASHDTLTRSIRDLHGVGARVLVILVTGSAVIRAYDAAIDAGFIGRPGFACVLLEFDFEEAIRQGREVHAGLIYASRPLDFDDSVEGTAYLANWTQRTVTYEASVHGSYNETSGRPFYDHAAPFWDKNADDQPDMWGRVVYDTVWLYAQALDNLTRSGVLPSDGNRLREQLTRSSIRGITGRVQIDPITQDRRPKAMLFNTQASANGSVAQVAVGVLPFAPTGGAGWLHTSLQWPGGEPTCMPWRIDLCARMRILHASRPLLALSRARAS